MHRLNVDILDLIRRGELHAGELLPREADLCVRFGVSRTSVRETVKYLQGKGLLRVEQGRGTWIQPMEQWDLLDADVWSAAMTIRDPAAMIRDLSDTRCVLERQIVELAAVHRTQAHVDKLDEYMREMAEAIARGAFKTYHSYSRLFHAQLGIASGNILLLKFSRSLNDAVEASKQNRAEDAEVARLSYAGHREIVEAVRRQDPDAAKAAMMRHLHDFESTVGEASFAARETAAESSRAPPWALAPREDACHERPATAQTPDVQSV